MKTIKQSKPGTCLAACLAMVTNQSEQYVLNQITLAHCPQAKLDYVPLSQAIIYLANHLYTWGCTFTSKNPLDLSTENYTELEFQIHIEPKTAPAIITVKSTPDLNHCLVWDNQAHLFRDPFPGKPDNSKLFYTDVIEVTPIQKILVDY